MYIIKICIYVHFIVFHIVLPILGILSLRYIPIKRQCVSGVKVRNSGYKSLSQLLPPEVQL